MIREVLSGNYYIEHLYKALYKAVFSNVYSSSNSIVGIALVIVAVAAIASHDKWQAAAAVAK
jgi:hypothetical protein